MSCAARDYAMQPELRLIEDFMTDKGAITLPAQPRMLYVVRGAITLGRRTIRAGEGELRVDTQGHSTTFAVGDAWYEAGPEPVFAQAGAKQTRFIRVMILPRALIGKSSISYVNAEDKDKPKSQQYRVFVDEPLTW